MKPEKLREKYNELEENFEMLRSDFLNMRDDTKQYKDDILRLLSIFVEKGIGIPEDIADRHIHRICTVERPPFS